MVIKRFTNWWKRGATIGLIIGLVIHLIGFIFQGTSTFHSLGIVYNILSYEGDYFCYISELIGKNCPDYPLPSFFYQLIFLIFFIIVGMLVEMIINKIKFKEYKGFEFRISLIIITLTLILITFNDLVMAGAPLDKLLNPFIFYVVFILISFLIGWLLDKKKYSSGIILLSVVIGYLPLIFGSTLFECCADNYEYLFYLYAIAAILPKSFLIGGHPSPIIFYGPILWLILGVLIAITIKIIQKRKKIRFLIDKMREKNQKSSG